MDIASIVVVVVLAGIFVYLGRLGWHRITMINREQELQDFEFESQILGSLGQVTNDDAAFIVPPKDSTAIGMDAAVPVVAPDAPAAAVTIPFAHHRADPELSYFRQPAQETLRGPLAQLAAANLASGIQDYFEYHGNAQGAGSFKLKDGRTGLLVPSVESEAFIARNLKRFDMLVMSGRDGKAYVVTSLEEFLSGQVRF